LANVVQVKRHSLGQGHAIFDTWRGSRKKLYAGMRGERSVRVWPWKRIGA